MRPPVVLVADDYADNREMYGEYLRHLGFRVLEADDGARAVAVARAHVPAAIVMDLSLPGIDGFEATRLLKVEPATTGIAIIAVTGHADARSRARALEAGCDAFLTKPCLPEDVARAVKRCLDAATVLARRGR